MTQDLKAGPDVLLILGTSLKVHGLKTLVREFAKSVHSRTSGRVIFINNEAPAASVWKDVIDCHVHLDTDAWVDNLRQNRPDMWPQQTSIISPGNKVRKVGKAVPSSVTEKGMKRPRKEASVVNKQVAVKSPKAGEPIKSTTPRLSNKRKAPTLEPSRRRVRSKARRENADITLEPSKKRVRSEVEKENADITLEPSKKRLRIEAEKENAEPQHVTPIDMCTPKQRPNSTLRHPARPHRVLSPQGRANRSAAQLAQVPYPTPPPSRHKGSTQDDPFVGPSLSSLEASTPSKRRKTKSFLIYQDVSSEAVRGPGHEEVVSSTELLTPSRKRRRDA